MQDRGPELAGTCASLLALAIVAVSVRCYVRLTLTKSFGYDDWLILATLVRPLCWTNCSKVSNQTPDFLRPLLRGRTCWSASWHWTA